MLRFFYCFIVLAVLGFGGCSSSSEETKDEKETPKDEYVFDVAKGDTTTVPVEVKEKPHVTETQKKYIVQIGAFTTKVRAEQYAETAKKKLSKDFLVSYSEEFKLFVVQLPPFASKDEAQKVRDVLWKTKDYKDAFIVVLP